MLLCCLTAIWHEATCTTVINTSVQCMCVFWTESCILKSIQCNSCGSCTVQLNLHRLSPGSVRCFHRSGSSRLRSQVPFSIFPGFVFLLSSFFWLLRAFLYFCAVVLLLVGTFSAYFPHLKYNKNICTSGGSVLLLLHGTYLDITSDMKFSAYLPFFMFKVFFFFSVPLLLVSAVGGLRR